MEKREVYVQISGYYCAFHEMSFSVVYDKTKNKELDEYTLEELENWESDYSDVELREAYLINNTYYVKW